MQSGPCISTKTIDIFDVPQRNIGRRLDMECNLVKDLVTYAPTFDFSRGG